MPIENDARMAFGKKRRAHRGGKTKGKIGFHSGKVAIERRRLRGFDGKAQPLPSWEGAMTEDWLGKWAMNRMLITVSTRKFERSVHLPEGDVPASKEAATDYPSPRCSRLGDHYPRASCL